MRLLRLAVALAFAASPAWAQPAAEPAGEANDPAAEKPVEPPSPTPEAGKDIVKQPPGSVEHDLARGDQSPLAGPVKPSIDTREHHADSGFRFGSYGRVLAGSDLRGGKPEQARVVAHGPRIVEPSYLELEFSYGFEKQRDGEPSIVVRPVITLAFDDTLFHDTGEFDAQPALRNMFVDGRIREDLSLWVGSRMYRGDDIYLFDYWPLDDINTVGGGIQYSPRVHIFSGEEKLEGAAHIGFNRLQNEFQFQAIEVANPVQGATIVEQLNRQRTVASATVAYVGLPSGDGMGTKLKVHGEYHALPSGTRKRTDGTLEALPADHGYLIGAELGAFGFSDNKEYRRHLNLFTRYAAGLAAFDELAPPTTFGRNLETTNANEFTFGVSGNWDHKLGNVMIGALSRRFIDADTNATDPDDGWEYAIDARPLVRVVPDFFIGGDVSYQARFPKGLNNNTLRAEDPAIFQIAPMLVWSPMGPSAYDRPQIRFVYRAAHLNQAALDEYVVEDPRHSREWVHFLGLQAEWWFNSSTYR
jgi:hypothetical protein